MKNFDVLGLLISALLTVGKEPAVTFLQSIYLKDSKLYKLVIFGLDYALSEGQVAALKSENKIDDSLIVALKEVIAASASSNSIIL